MVLLSKCIGNAFYYKNALEMVFTIKMHWKCFLLWFCTKKNALEIILLLKCIGNDFYSKNALEMIVTIKMH